jgi:hypothetical protein
MPDALVAWVAALLDRDLRGLRRELEAYPDERQIWQPAPGMPNTAGTLALHIAGNLQHFIGAQWAETGYRRDREAEFGRRDVPRAELVAEVERARSAVAAGLGRIPLESLGEDYPLVVVGARLTTGDYLIHLCVHAAYHLGQLDTHRRLVTGSASGVGVVGPAELGSARPVAD